MITAPFRKLCAVMIQVYLFAIGCVFIMGWSPVDSLNNSLLFHALLELIRARHDRDATLDSTK